MYACEFLRSEPICHAVTILDPPENTSAVFIVEKSLLDGGQSTFQELQATSAAELRELKTENQDIQRHSTQT
jgi:hypothetical protein